MTDPPGLPHEPHRPLLSTLRSRWKDLLIAALSLAVVALGAVVLRDRLPWAAAGAPPAAEGEPVSVFEVVLDRETGRAIDILFDRPVVEEMKGEILDRPPATLSPAIGGFWSWRDRSVLRFEASGPLPMATEISVSLIAARLEALGKRLEGESEFTVRTDRFLVERVDVQEEPALEARGRVLLRGSIYFNYPVDPRVLATRIRLVDPAAPGAAPPAIELETGWTSQVIGFRSTPIAKKKEERTLELRIAGDVTPEGGNVPLAEEFVHKVQIGSSEILTVRGFEIQPGVDETSVRLRLSSPVAPSVARPYVTIDPEVSFRLAAAGNELVLTGKLAPGSTYQLALGASLPAEDDAVLKAPWSTRLAVPDLEPSIDFQSPGMFLPRTGSHAVALEAVNVSRAKLVVERVYLNNLFYLFQYEGFQAGGTTYEGNSVGPALGNRLAEDTLEVGGERNRKRVVPIDVDAFVGDEVRGLYRLALSRPGDWQASQRLLLLTDLGLVGKRSGDGFLVWVTSSRTLAPVEGARVTLLSRQNQPLASGSTDASGMWRASGLREAFDKSAPYLVTVERGGDFSFLLLDRMQVDTSGLDVGGAPSRGEGYTAFLYGERDLYRPGETARGVVALRDEELRAPPSMPAVLRHRDPTGVEREDQLVTTDAAGLAEFELDLPVWSLTGGHALELLVAEEVVGRYRFQVEEFVPDRIKVEIRPASESVGPGEDLSYDVASAYLFGPPAAGLPVETRVRVEDASFAPAGYEEFVFRNPDRKIAQQELFSEEAQLGEDGTRRFTVRVPRGAEVPSALDAVLIGRVSERGGRGVTAVRRVRVHPYPYYVGLRRIADGYAEPGKDVSFEYAAVGRDGKPAQQTGLRAELIQDRWNTVLRRLPSGNYRYESTREGQPIDSRAIASGTDRGRFEFRVPEYGSYRVVLTDVATSASAQIEFYASGWGYAPWAVSDPSRIELTLEREEFQPGETANVLVKAPFSGKLLLTVERDRVYHTSVHDLAGNTASIAVPVREAWRPNAYVTATLIRKWSDLEPGGVGRAFGAVPIQVDRASNRLDVRLRAPDRLRSESRLSIDVDTVPGGAVTVAAVDEGILQLVAQKTPDPFGFFYRKLALGARTFDTYALLLPEVRLEDRAATGGGEGGAGIAQYLQTESIRRVEPVAFWSGVLRADGRGRARVEFDLPEFQGALRLMAVALDGRRFGAGEALVRVRDPIVLTPTWPRFLSLEEQVRLPVTVRNDTGKAAEVRVELEVAGAAQAAGGREQVVKLENAAETTVYFDVTTGATTGEASFVARAAAGAETTRSSAKLPVRADLPQRTTDLAGALAERSRTLEPDERWARPGTLTRTLRIGPVPLVQFSGKLEGLLRYPYGCLEQTVSTAFPLLYLEELAASLEPELFGDAADYGSPAEFVQEGIRRVEGFRLDDGGFALWQGAREAQPWSSVYATHFLVEARRAGYSVSDSAHDAALSWVERAVVAKPEYAADERKRVVYGAWVLARADRADPGTLDFLRDKHAAAMTGDERAMLAAAFAQSGNLGAVDDLLREILKVEQVSRRTGDNFDSTLRDRALLLLALLDASPDDPRIADLVDQLARAGGETPYWNTQERALTFLALGRFYQRQASRPAYRGVVRVGQREIGRFTNAPVTFTDLPLDAPVRIEMDSGYEPGAAYFALTTRAVPRDEAYAAESAGLEVARDYLDRDGHALDLERVRQGDLIVVRTRVRSVAGPVRNVVVQNLLPAGLEVENPRLETTETLPWVAEQPSAVAHVDLRDDRILLFLDLPANTWQTAYALVRAVSPGRFRLPPVQAEAMYDGTLRASGARGTIAVEVRE